MGATSHCAGNAAWEGPLSISKARLAPCLNNFICFTPSTGPCRGSLQEDPQRQNHVFDDVGSSWIKGGPGEKQVTFLRAATLTPIV